MHLRDMQLSYKEDFATGTSAAAAGGFTTVLDMPNTLPPTDSPQRLVEKQERAKEKIRVNVGFHAAATSDKRTIQGLVKAGAFSLKLYMPKPIAPFKVDDASEVRGMMKEAESTGIPVTVHAEDILILQESKRVDSFEQLAAARTPSMESRAVERILSIQAGTKCRVHFCHITLASSLRRVRDSSNRVTSEVTPHHLLLSAKSVRNLGWKAWMVPPLRSEGERHDLIHTVSNGLADVVGSDHAPHTISEKKRSPSNSPPGVPGLETTTPLLLTLVNKRILTMSRIIGMLATGPAKIFGLKTKGRLEPGFDGDLVLVDLKKTGHIDSSKFQSKAKFSPFDGFRTKGAVVATIVGGALVYSGGKVVGRRGSGAVLRNNLLN